MKKKSPAHLDVCVVAPLEVCMDWVGQVFVAAGGDDVLVLSY